MKVAFLTSLDLRYLGDGTWEVLAPFVVRINGKLHTVEAGFRTDLDSVPRLPLTYWLAKGRAIWSAVLHDWLYTQRKPRKWADEVMYAAMETEGVGAIVKKLIYAGVRVGGWDAYRKKEVPVTG